jgi:transposase, IS30 family
MRKYQRISIGEREEISRSIVMGVSLRQIGRDLGREASTISREIGRFEQGRAGYRAYRAQRSAFVCEQRRRRDKRKLLLDRELMEVVRSKLKEQWSPEQIAQYLKRT